MRPLCNVTPYDIWVCLIFICQANKYANVLHYAAQKLMINPSKDLSALVLKEVVYYGSDKNGEYKFSDPIRY